MGKWITLQYMSNIGEKKHPLTFEKRATGGKKGKGRSKHLLQNRLVAETIKQANDPMDLRTKAEIMLAAGYSSRTVEKKSSAIWSAEGVQEAFAAAGLSPQFMSKIYGEAGKANVVTVFHGDAQETDAPDHSIRLRAADQIADVMGLKKMTIEQRTINVNLGGDELMASLGL